MTLKVTQGHQKWCNSMGDMSLPISGPCWQCLYLAPLSRYVTTFTWRWDFF